MYLLNNFGNSYMLRNGSLSQFPLVIRFLHTEIAQFKKSALELSLTHMLQFHENWQHNLARKNESWHLFKLSALMIYLQEIPS